MNERCPSPEAIYAGQLDDLEPSPPACERRLVTASGASASVHERAGGERIQVHDTSSRLVFELDAVTGRMLVCAPSGDISFRALGDVEFVAGGSVRCRGAKQVALEAGDGADRSSMVLDKGVAGLSSRALRLAADSAELVFVEATCRSERVRASIGDAKLALTRLETVTDRLFEQARSVFRQVEDLHQLRAGRSRTVVTGGYSVKSGHASIEAEADVKIDGSKIHLG